MNVSGIKLEFFHHSEKRLEEPEVIESVHLESLRDNAAMKLSALVKRGQKKDFADLAELLRYEPLEFWMRAFSEKFPRSEQFMLVEESDLVR